MEVRMARMSSEVQKEKIDHASVPRNEDGSYRQTRTKKDLCRKYNAGSCQAKPGPSGACPDTGGVHSCHWCLGTHPATSCRVGKGGDVRLYVDGK